MYHVQWCSTFCSPMDCSLPGSSVHGILQAWILEWVAIPSARGSSQPRDPTQASRIGIAGGFFTIWTIREAHMNARVYIYMYICINTHIHTHICVPSSTAHGETLQGGHKGSSSFICFPSRDLELLRDPAAGRGQPWPLDWGGDSWILPLQGSLSPLWPESHRCGFTVTLGPHPHPPTASNPGR